MRSFIIFTHPDPEWSGSSLPTGRQASLRAEREKRVSQFQKKTITGIKTDKLKNQNLPF